MILPADHVLRAVINARLPVPLLLLVCFWSYLFHVVMFPYQVGDVPLTCVAAVDYGLSAYHDEEADGNGTEESTIVELLYPAEPPEFLKESVQERKKELIGRFLSSDIPYVLMLQSSYINRDSIMARLIRFAGTIMWLPVFSCDTLGEAFVVAIYPGIP
ncbi:hypothetical protein Tco_0286603 [Tanacetum coccineum]